MSEMPNGENYRACAEIFFFSLIFPIASDSLAKSKKRKSKPNQNVKKYICLYFSFARNIKPWNQHIISIYFEKIFNSTTVEHGPRWWRRGPTLC